MKTIFLKPTTDPKSEKVVEGAKYRELWEECAIPEYVSWVHLHYHNQTHTYPQLNGYRENDEKNTSSGCSTCRTCLKHHTGPTFS